MKRILGSSLAAAAAGLMAVSLTGTSFAQERVISSDDTRALAPPRAWDCRKIYPEYRAWLDAGNTAETWRYVGPTYRDVADGTRYNWGDWLAWYDRSCPAAVVAGDLPGNTELIGGVVGALGLTAIFAAIYSGGGERNDSPG